MEKKLVAVVLIWVIVIAVYIIIAAAMPAITGLTSSTSALLSTTSNMTNYPGSLEVVDSAPVWIWAVPGLVGMIATVIYLKRD